MPWIIAEIGNIIILNQNHYKLPPEFNAIYPVLFAFHGAYLAFN